MVCRKSDAVFDDCDLQIFCRARGALLSLVAVRKVDMAKMERL